MVTNCSIQEVSDDMSDCDITHQRLWFERRVNELGPTVAVTLFGPKGAVAAHVRENEEGDMVVQFLDRGGSIII